WTYNDAGLSLAEAVATFKDGGHYRESGDATPENATKKGAPHFRRVAFTRATARVLRDALGVELVAAEGLAQESRRAGGWHALCPNTHAVTTRRGSPAKMTPSPLS